MSVRFEPPARKAIERAMIAAENRAHGTLETVHLLFGLLGEPNGSVAKFLSDSGVTVSTLRAQLEKTLEAAPSTSSATIQVADATESILEKSGELAQARGAAEVSELDILQACAQSGNTGAATVLRSVGVTPEKLQRGQAARLGSALARPSSPTPVLGVPRFQDSGKLASMMEAITAGQMPLSITRTGIGYDSHRFAPGIPLVLGGVNIESDVGLAGHSDGDAVAHAITDAVLGAAGAGDIGEMFSDQDPANKGRDSIEMLRLAVGRVRSSGWIVQQVDVSIIAERPRISRHKERMREILALALGVSPDCVSVKGKTNEGMGWIGRAEGIACMAVATIVTAPPGRH